MKIQIHSHRNLVLDILFVGVLFSVFMVIGYFAREFVIDLEANLLSVGGGIV